MHTFRGSACNSKHHQGMEFRELVGSAPDNPNNTTKCTLLARTMMTTRTRISS